MTTHEDFLTIMIRAQRLQGRATGAALAAALVRVLQLLGLRKREPGPASPRWVGKGKVLVLPSGRPLSVACLAGTLWITDGNADDLVLQAGQSLLLQPRSSVIVSAISGAARVGWQQGETA